MEILLFLGGLFLLLFLLVAIFPWLGHVIMGILWLFGAVERHVPDGRGGYWKI